MTRQWTDSLIVPRTHPSLAGHFPGRPIVPGAVLLDLICAAVQAGLPPGLRMAAVTHAKFLQPVAPDARLVLSIDVENEVGSGSLRARFRASLQEEAVLEGMFTFVGNDVASAEAP